MLLEWSCYLLVAVHRASTLHCTVGHYSEVLPHLGGRSQVRASCVDGHGKHYQCDEDHHCVKVGREEGGLQSTMGGVQDDSHRDEEGSGCNT